MDRTYMTTHRQIIDAPPGIASERPDVTLAGYKYDPLVNRIHLLLRAGRRERLVHVGLAPTLAGAVAFDIEEDQALGIPRAELAEIVGPAVEEIIARVRVAMHAGIERVLSQSMEEKKVSESSAQD